MAASSSRGVSVARIAPLGPSPWVPLWAGCWYALRGARMRRMVGPEPPSAAANRRPRRSLATAYLIWFLLGIFGAHRFYLGDARAGRRFLVALGVGVALPVIGLLLALATRSFEGVSLGLIGWSAGLLVLLGVL